MNPVFHAELVRYGLDIVVWTERDQSVDRFVLILMF